MGIQVKNNAYSTLNGSILAGDTSLVIQTGHGSRFPAASAGNYFYCTLQDASANVEIIKVTTRSGDTFSVIERAQEGTSAIGFANGSAVELRPTAQTVIDLATQAVVGSITATIIDAKGDLITGSAADTPVRKGVGANGYVLTADSSKSDGLDWTLPYYGGQCIFQYISTSTCRLNRRNGKYIIINGVPEIVPSAGVDIANSALASNDTTYYIYAYMNTGTMTLEASGTAYTTDSTTGIQIKTGDATRSLVGMARKTSGNFVNSTTTCLVRTWFNDKGISLSAGLGNSVVIGSSPWIEISSSVRAFTLLWAGEKLYGSGSCVLTDGDYAPGLQYFTLGVDGAINVGGDANLYVYNHNANTTYSTGVAYSGVWSSLVEGYHYLTALGGIGPGTTPLFTFPSISLHTNGVG